MPQPNRSILISRYLRPVLLGLGMATLLAACKTPPTVQEKTADWSPNRIYSEARDERLSGGYDQAIPLYDVLEARAQGTPLAQQAQLEKAYAQYQNEDYVDANLTLDRFIQMHPTSPALDYAYYLKGLVNFNEQSGWLDFLNANDLSERDMAAARESFAAFKELTTRFPNSRYTPDARARMTYIVNAMASSEVAIANYYFSREAYVAAINRAQSTLTNYPGTPAQEQALGIMAQSYHAMGMEQPRDDALRVLKENFPQSRYLDVNHKVKEKRSWFRLW